MSSPAPSIRSVLIVRLSAIGDVIHALPVLDALHHLLPNARLGWVVEELSAPLLENHPYLDKIYVIPKKRWRKYWHALYIDEIRPFFQQMRSEGWDAVIDLQGLTKSGFVAKSSGARIRVGFGDKDGRELNKLFTNRKVKPPDWATHVVERNLSLLEGLNLVAPKDVRGRLGILPEEQDAMRQALAESGWTPDKRLLALNPGAGWASKRWESAKYAEAGAALSRRKRLYPLILWGPGEEHARDTIQQELSRQSIEHFVAPQTNLRELAALISLCHLFIGGDTGPTQMAGLLNIPNVAIFGASDAKRNRPWPIESGTVVQQTELFCVPCWKTVCPLKEHAHMACLREIKPGRVIEAAVDVVEKHAVLARSSSGAYRRVG